MTTLTRSAFEVVSLPHGDDGALRSHIVAHCSKCDETEAVLVSKASGNVPPEVGGKFFRHRGWRMGANRSRDTCPKCAGAARIRAAPEAFQMDAIFEVASDLGARRAESEDMMIVELPRRPRKPRHVDAPPVARVKARAPRLVDDDADTLELAALRERRDGLRRACEKRVMALFDELSAELAPLDARIAELSGVEDAPPAATPARLTARA